MIQSKEIKTTAIKQNTLVVILFRDCIETSLTNQPVIRRRRRKQ